jgi:hypothetical protein
MWLENFKKMKQAAIDSLYKDRPKHWTALRFNLEMLMLKAHHGWSDTSFNDPLRVLADTYPEGNKVPANSYRPKKMIWPVAMKLKKFHACHMHIWPVRVNHYKTNTARSRTMIRDSSTTVHISICIQPNL